MNDVMLCDFFKNFFLAIHPILLPKQWKKWIQLWSVTHTHTKTQNCPLSTWGGIVWFHFFALVRKNDSIELEQRKKIGQKIDCHSTVKSEIIIHRCWCSLFRFWWRSFLLLYFHFSHYLTSMREEREKKSKESSWQWKKKMCYPDLQWWTTTNWSAKTKVPLNIHSSIAHLHSTQSLTTLNIFLYNEQQQQQKKRENNSPKHREIYSSKWNTH